MRLSCQSATSSCVCSLHRSSTNVPIACPIMHPSSPSRACELAAVSSCGRQGRPASCWCGDGSGALEPKQATTPPEDVGMSTITNSPGRTAPEEDGAILDAVGKWLERDVRPHVHALEHDDIYPREMVEQMKALGLFGATISTAYGGLGLSATTYANIVQRVSEVWMSLAGIFNSHLIMASCVERVGTEEQKRAYLPRFATGELRGGLALTEPDCGTDLQAIRTRAVRAGNEAYLVNGTKTWISNGIHGQVFALLVKTDPSAEPRHKGMSMLLAEKGPGFRVSRKLEKIGYKGIDSAELIFEDYRVTTSALIGGVEGRGLQTALGGLELGRINVAARGCGLAKAALEESVRYAQQRKTFGKPIHEHQAIQLKLAEMAIRTEAAIALTYNAARAYDEG